MRNKKIRTFFLFLILYGTMFFFGYIENIKGVTYPLIKAEFGVSYKAQGYMVSLLSMSYMLFCLFGGMLLGKKGVKQSFLSGFLVMIAGLAGVFFMPRFLLVAGALFLVSAGFGLFEVSLNALATRIFTTRAALLMNLLHFFYGAGSSLSPRAAGILAASRGWRTVYLFTVPFILVLFVFSVFSRFSRQEGENGSEKGVPESSAGQTEKKPDPSGIPVKKAGFFDALKNPLVWIFSVALGFMEVVEICSANWAGLYFQDVYHLDPKTAGAAFVSNFFILFTISRLVSGFIIEKAGYMRSLLAAALASLVVFVIGLALGEKGIHVLPALGFFSAIFWPTIMAVAMGVFREDAPVMTSAIIVIAGALNSIFQMFIGLFNQLAGPAWGYRSCLVYTVLCCAALVVLAKSIRRARLLPKGGRA